MRIVFCLVFNNPPMGIMGITIYSLFDERVDVILKCKKIRHLTMPYKNQLYYYCDNQLDSGFAISLALLYAISSVRQVCP